MARTATLLKFTARPGQRGALVAAYLSEATRVAVNESEIELYLIHTSLTEPDAVWLYVAFTSEAAEDAYTRGAAGNSVMSRIDALAPAPPEHFDFVPVGGKGLPSREG